MAEIPKIVGQRLRAIAEPVDHPDPNLLGAFADRSLGKRERVQVLEHLSACSSCRETVSLSAPQPGTADVAPVITASPAWSAWSVVRWGAVVACVMVIGAAVTLRHRQESRQVAAVLPEGKATAETQVSAAMSAIEKKPVSLPGANPEAKTVARHAARPPKAVTGIPPAGSYASMNSRAVEMAEARTPSAFAEVVPGRAKDAATEPQGAQAKAVGSLLTRNRTTVSMTAASPAIAQASLAPRWTLSSDGTLERSLDSGRTWQTIEVSSRAVFRALAANGLDIWVGGSAGALFHSSDAGQRWTQVRPAVNGEALADDIIGVEFTDALRGKVTSSTAETWITADAGQTWQKQ